MGCLRDVIILPLKRFKRKLIRIRKANVTMSSVGSEGSESSNSSRIGEIVKTGYLKKLKTMKKKFFVLRADSSNTQACLEYYDSGKKWKNNNPPKRRIILRNCFNINRRTDTKHKHVIALFTGNDYFGIVFDCEEDLLDWLKLFLMYQQGEDMMDCGVIKPFYEHVWRITMQKKELAIKHNLHGVFLLCLTDCTISLVKNATEEEQETKYYEFSLQSIRRCGNLDSFVYMELGQASSLGAGNLWMQAEDSNTAQHMHTIIMNACTNCPKKELGPKSRSRSSSANEASKPRRWPSNGDTGRERCDSLPTRPRMTLDTLSHARSGNTVSHLTPVSGRPHSMYTRGVLSPSGCSHPTSPMSATYSTDSAGSSLSVDGDSENWSEMESSTYMRKIILEENSEDYVQWGGNQNKNFLAENIPYTNNSCRSIKSICHHSSSNSQSSCSPCSSSPLDAAGYLPMSPESVAENRTRQQLNRSYDSVNHSRESSIHEDLTEGYVPMAPLSVDTGYLSMDQSSRKPGDISPGLSSCSITSGTPSTDARLSEFHLDKVSSYLTPSDDDIIFNVRPTRAYSTGSKPDVNQNKFVRCDSADGLRVRAFSVGSRYVGHNMPPTPRRTPASTSTSSIEPCDDLMEIDFSANKLRHRQHLRTRTHLRHQGSLGNGGNGSNGSNGIVHTSNEKLTVPHNAAAFSSSTDYMDMSPKSSPKLESSSSLCDSRLHCSSDSANVSPPRLTKHLMGRSAPISVGYSSKQVYVKGSPSASGSGALEKVIETESSQSSNSSSKLRLSDDESSYMDMKPGVCDVPDNVGGSVVVAPKVTTPVIATATDLHARKESFTILDPSICRSAPATCTTLPHIKQPLIDTEGKQFRNNSISTPTSASLGVATGTPEGYMDMTFKSRQQPTKSIPRIPDKTPDGYVDMSFKGGRKNLVDSNSTMTTTTPVSSRHSNKSSADTKNHHSNASCCSGKENQMVVDPRQSSKPIAIQQNKCKRSNSSGFFRRKQSVDETNSTSTKPNFLPLGLSIPTTFASLGRKSKKTAAALSSSSKKADKIESPAGSNSGIMFPLSPDRTPSLDYDPNSKCAISASGESIKLTGGDYEIRSCERVDLMANNWDHQRGSSAAAEDDEHSAYAIMTPGIGLLQRKTSEPACLNHHYITNSRSPAIGSAKYHSHQQHQQQQHQQLLQNSKSLHRSTSVPAAISNIKNRSPSFSELCSRKECCHREEMDDRSDISGSSSRTLTNECETSQRMDVDVTVGSSSSSSSCEAKLNLVDVPKASASDLSAVRMREKITYATLDLPPAEPDDNSNKEDSESSSNAKLSEKSKLTYAQIDFEKASSSSFNNNNN
ncbi:uncharacterized protein chico isoform X7 [Planococcus citri]|uniref:uncharacterized protein chico isoform X7 n=1 Tax=Planococcus citri TaxID=170843 RepID=UPI0031F7A3F2